MDIPVWVALSIILLTLVLSFRSSISWRRSIRCICSKITSLCGVVSSTTCLTGWEDRFWSSVSLIIYIVSFGIVCNFVVVGVRIFWALPLLLLALFVLFRVWSFSRLSWRHWFWWWLGFLQWRHVGLGLLEFCCGPCCVTVFMGISSGASKPSNSNSLSRCDTICSYVPFSKCAWLIDFFRCGGILA